MKNFNRLPMGDSITRASSSTSCSSSHWSACCNITSSAARRTRPSPSRPWWSRRCGPAPPLSEIVKQVTDRIEKKLEELPNLDYLKSYTKPGESVVFVNLKDSTRASDVPDLWYQVRKKVGDIKQTLPRGGAGAVLQ